MARHPLGEPKKETCACIMTGEVKSSKAWLIHFRIGTPDFAIVASSWEGKIMLDTDLNAE